MAYLAGHPYIAGLGGVKVLVAPDEPALTVLAVFDTTTDEPVAWAQHYWEERPDRDLPVLALSQGRLAQAFPGKDNVWYLGRPWEGEVTIRVLSANEDRARGELALPNEPHTLLWTAEVAHTSGGRMWRYDLLAWPTTVNPLDTVFLGRVLEIADRMVKAGVTPAESTQTLTNTWTGRPPFLTGVPFLVADGDNIWVKYLRRCRAMVDQAAGL